MQIFVQGLDEGVRAISTDGIETLDQVKTLILHRSSMKTANILNHPLHTASFYFSCGGKTFVEGSKLTAVNVRQNSLIKIIPRVCGGGGDGGATGAESRDCYLKMYSEKKPDKVDPNETRICKWSTCALSQETLKPPCVIDRLGNIFNKEALVRALLGKSLPPQFSHVKGLKDMISVHLDPIPGVSVLDNVSETKFQCPISGLEFNGKCKFFALSGCGHVLSAKALKEVQSTACLVCHKPFGEDAKIVINGNEEEVEVLRAKMEQERAAKLKDRKAKKGKNGAETIEIVEKVEAKGDLNGDKVYSVCGKRKGEENLDGEVGNGKDKAKVKKFRAVDLAPANATKEVYASIFTSSRKQDEGDLLMQSSSSWQELIAK